MVVLFWGLGIAVSLSVWGGPVSYDMLRAPKVTQVNHRLGYQ